MRPVRMIRIGIVLPIAGDHDQRHHDARDRQEGVVDPAERAVHHPPADRRGDSERDPHEVGQERRSEGDSDGRARAVQRPGKRVAPDIVGAQPGDLARGLEIGRGIRIVAARHDEQRLVEDVRLVVGRDGRADEHDDHPERDHADPELAAPGELQPPPWRCIGQLLELGRGSGAVIGVRHLDVPISGAAAWGSTGSTPCPR